MTSLRVLALLVGLQLSGFVHDVSDVVSAFAPEHASEHEPCPVNGPCEDCPAGCPNCHCSLAMASVLPPLAAGLTVERYAARVFSSPRYESRAPASPDRSLPFRPPRA